MEHGFTFLFMVINFQYICGQRYELCANGTNLNRSCSKHVLGDKHAYENACLVEYVDRNANECSKDFTTVMTQFNLGELNLRATSGRDLRSRYLNKTFIEIIFRSIKWKHIRFRMQNFARKINHCRNIMIYNNVTVYEEKILNYDCYWSKITGSLNREVHIFDFEATDGNIFSRGQYHFFIPSQKIFSPSINETTWEPFIYVENREDSMVLHMMSAPKHLNITEYQIEVKTTKDEQNLSDETVEQIFIKKLTHKYVWPLRGGRFYFVVTPIHEKCKIEEKTCLSVKSPIIFVNDPLEHQMVYISIAVVAVLVVIFLTFLFVRRNCSKKLSSKIPPPTKVLVVYPVKNCLHVKCVESLVHVLRHDYGIDVMYDGDIYMTSHRDPYYWAKQAIEVASKVMYVVGPSDDAEVYNHIYTNIDSLLLTILKDTRIFHRSKNILTVYFDHSDGTVPIEVSHGRKFYLLDDWNKFTACLSKDLLPRTTIELSDTGKTFIKKLSQVQNP